MGEVTSSCGRVKMSHNIYNLYPAVKLSSGRKIYLQSIIFSHTYDGLLCGSPSEQINHNILLDINEKFSEGLFIIEPKITTMSENDFFGRINSDQDDQKQIPVLPPVKVQVLFECYDDEDLTYLNIVWFQNDFTLSIPTEIIQNTDWDKYACEVSL